MKKTYLSFFFIFILSFHLKSQVIYDQGAVSTSMAGLNVTENNLWSINNNVGNLAGLINTQVGISINNRFLLKKVVTKL